MRVTSEGNDAKIAIAIVGLPPVDIRTVGIDVTNIHELAIMGQT